MPLRLCKTFDGLDVGKYVWVWVESFGTETPSPDWSGPHKPLISNDWSFVP